MDRYPTPRCWTLFDSGLARRNPSSRRKLRAAARRRISSTTTTYCGMHNDFFESQLSRAVARLYQAHFGAVLVDEFQDLSIQQLDLALLSCTQRRTFAGDPLQGIYSWAGASPTHVEAEIRRTCGPPLRLHESYRSSPNVLRAVNSISEQVEPGSSLISAQPDHWPAGGCSARLVLPDRTEEAAALARLPAGILSEDPEASVGIITRAAWRREDINNAFAGEEGFSVRRWDLAIEDPAIVALIQSIVSTLPRGTSVANARLAVQDAVEPADIEVRELIDDASTPWSKAPPPLPAQP